MPKGIPLTDEELDRRRHAIFSASVNLFLENGFGETSMREIAAAAGMGKAMSCSSCHSVHGSVTPPLMSHDTVNDNCFSCHAEKRGPFLWEHAPVNENCLDCHDPHGSTRAFMLKLNPPRLCQQCHIENRHPTEARLPGNKLVIGRSCVQCHSNIHGSNHPSGHAFTR